jgi:hypothetical protein
MTWSGGYSSASHTDDLGSGPIQVAWHLLWTKRRWGRFSPRIVVSTGIHSTKCSTLILHEELLQQGKCDRPTKWAHSGPSQETKRTNECTCFTNLTWFLEEPGHSWVCLVQVTFLIFRLQILPAQNDFCILLSLITRTVSSVSSRSHSMRATCGNFN